MSDKNELERRAEVFRAILKTMKPDNPDRASYKVDLEKIEAEIAAAKQPVEDVREDAPAAPLPEEGELAVQQAEELDLPPEKSEGGDKPPKPGDGTGKPGPEDKAGNQYQKILVEGVIKVLAFLNTPVFGEKKTKNGN